MADQAESDLYVLQHAHQLLNEMNAPCEAKKRNRPARPLNGFFVYRKLTRTIVKETHKTAPESQLSEKIGNMWRNLKKEERDHFYAVSAVLRREHAQRNPGYVYRGRTKTRTTRPEIGKFRVRVGNGTLKSPTAPTSAELTPTLHFVDETAAIVESAERVDTRPTPTVETTSTSRPIEGADIDKVVADLFYPNGEVQPPEFLRSAY